MPIIPEKVAMFVAYMDSVGNARTTIRTYISALSREHKLADEDDPTAKFWVRKVVDAASSGASAPRVKRPIMLEILKKILWAANRVLAEFDASLMRAVFSLAFHATPGFGRWSAPMVSHSMQSWTLSFHYGCTYDVTLRNVTSYSCLCFDFNLPTIDLSITLWS